MNHMMNRRFILVPMLSAGLMICVSPLQASSWDEDIVTLHSSRDAAARAAAKKHLYSGGADAIAAIVNAMGKADHDSRINLMQDLVSIRLENQSLQVRDADSHELAHLARQEKDPDIHRRLVLSLWELRGPAAIEELEKFAADEPEEWVRVIATHHVASMSANESTFLKKQTDDPSPQVELAAYLELARLGDKSGRAFALNTLTNSKEHRERNDAIEILGEIGNSKDIPRLKQIVDAQTEDYKAKMLAVRALKNIEYLGTPENGRLSFLIKSLDDKDGLIRVWAYGKLWKSTDASTSSRLDQYLNEPGHLGYKEAADARSLR